MRPLLPKSLFGQTLGIILTGLLLSQVIGAWIYAHDRSDAVHAIGGMSAAQRIANLARLVEDSPSETRDRIVRTLSDASFQVTLRSAMPEEERTSPETSAAEAGIRDYLAGELSRPHDIQVSLDGVATSEAAPKLAGTGMGGMGMGMGKGMGRGRMTRAMGIWRELSVAIRMEDGRWLTVHTGIPDQPPPRSWWLFAALGAMGTTVLAASAWAMRRAIAPLRLLSDAANRFARDAHTPPLEEKGPAEIRLAIAAFNRMQDSLKRLMENRSKMLAGVSHDLRTPLTLLRLRIEGVENDDERARMLASVADMEGMLGAALDFARDTGRTEARRRTDITALLASIVDDMADAGRDVTMRPSDPAICPVQPAALKRALTNLIDNAVKFGGHVEVQVSARGGRIDIQIDDQGPGIPEDMLEKVFEPFVRIEESRNSETGGTGLGLSIAMATLRNHGGDIRLSNRPEGGLTARVSLPLPKDGED